MRENAIARPFISTGVFDILLIIGAPVLAFTAVTLVSMPRSATGQFLSDPSTPEWFVIFSTLMTHTHVLLVFVRSHANRNVFRRFPARFILVPIFVLATFTISPLASAFMAFVALYWDEWHSLMQTFGFGRIYDSKLGNDPNIGRKLDIGMCFVLGLLPHVLLLTFLPENVRTQGLQEFLDLSQETAEKYGHYIHSLKWPLLIFGGGYTLFYVASYWKLIKNGYKYSRAKLSLFAATGASAILIASFYSVTDAAYFGNIYHALQYFFIVCLIESPRISGRFTLPKINKKVLAIFCGFFILSVASVAAVARLKSETFGFLGNFWLLTSLLHFWYDGFIWSVRNQDI